jgi:hypothetical protein
VATADVVEHPHGEQGKPREELNQPKLLHGSRHTVAKSDKIWHQAFFARLLFHLSDILYRAETLS